MLFVPRLLISSLLIALAVSPTFARTWVVDQASPHADDAGDGSTERPFRSISPAAAAAQAGDTVLVQPGVYRERITPARGGEKDKPIVYQAAERGKVLVRGSDVVTSEWVENPSAKGVFTARLDPSLLSEQSPFRHGISIDSSDKSKVVRPFEGELEHVLGEVFVNGEPYVQLTSCSAVASREKSWWATNNDAIMIHFPAELERGKAMVEITTRDRVFAPHRRGLGFIEVRGFVFEQCANQGPFPQGGMVSTRSGHDWLIEQNTIRYAATIGLDCGGESFEPAKLTDTDPDQKKIMAGTRNLIRDNDVSDNGLCGIAGWNCRDSRIVGNRVERNNRRGFPHGKGGWEEWAGIKLHCTNAVVAGNVIRDNLAYGIWFDNGYYGARIDSNIILRNKKAGVFCELGASPGKPCVIANNVIGGTTGDGGFYPGFGIYAHDASDLIVAHNLVFDNASFGLLMRTITDRTADKKLVETSRIRIANNVFANNGGAMSLPYANERSVDVESDGNVFAGGATPQSSAFRLNKYQGTFRWPDVYSELRSRSAKAGQPEEKLPEESAFAKDPSLTLDQWRPLMAMDAGSVAGAVAVSCDDRTLPARLSLKIGDAAKAAVCKPVDEAGSDFFGRSRKEGALLPGPFSKVESEDAPIALKPLIHD